MSFSIRKPYKTVLNPVSGSLTLNWALSPNPVGARTDGAGAINAFSYQESAFGNDRWVTSSIQAYPSQRQLISTNLTADFFDICGNYDTGSNIGTTFFANGRFFLGTTGFVPYSTNGLNWVDVSDASLSTVKSINGFTSIPSTGRIVGIGDNAAVYSDNSGNSWNVVSIPLFPGNKIAYNPTADILAAVDISKGGARSLNKGLSWTTYDISRGNFSGLAFGNGVFIAVNRTTSTVWRSTDGLNWTWLQNFGSIDVSGFNPRSVAFGNGIFAVSMANGANPWPNPTGPGIVISSDNGDTWQALQTPYNTVNRANRWQGITYANGIFVVSAEVSSGTYNMNGKPFIPIRYTAQRIIPKYQKI